MDHRNDCTWSNINIILSLSFRLSPTAISISLAYASRAEHFTESEMWPDQPEYCMLCFCVIVKVLPLRYSPFDKTIRRWSSLSEIYLFVCCIRKEWSFLIVCCFFQFFTLQAHVIADLIVLFVSLSNAIQHKTLRYECRLVCWLIPKFLLCWCGCQYLSSAIGHHLLKCYCVS